MFHLERPPEVQPAVPEKGTQSTARCKIKRLQDKTPARLGVSADSVSVRASRAWYLHTALANPEVRVLGLLLGKDDRLN